MPSYTKVAASSSRVSRDVRSTTISSSSGDTASVHKGKSTSPISLDIDHLNNKITNLAGHADALTEEHKKDSIGKEITSIAHTISLISSSSVFPKVTDHIRKVFPRDDYKIGTIGALFKGCMMKGIPTFGGEIHCGPTCAGNVLPAGEKRCSDNVAILRSTGLDIRQHLESSTHLILHTTKDSCELTNAHISTLKSMGIETIEVFRYDENTKQSEVIVPSCSVSSIVSEYSSSSSKTGQSTHSHRERPVEKCGNNWGWIAVLVVIVVFVLIIGLVIWMMCSCGDRVETVNTERVVVGTSSGSVYKGPGFLA